MQPRLDAKPSDPTLPEWLGLGKHEQAAAAVCAQVVQVRVHGVGSPPEVHVVRKVEGVFKPVVLRHVQLELEVAAQRVQLAVALLHLL